MSKKQDIERQIKNAQKALREWPDWMKASAQFHGSETYHRRKDQAHDRRTPHQPLRAGGRQMKTYKQPPPWPNDPQQWDTRHDIRMFLEKAIGHANIVRLCLEELEANHVVPKDKAEEIEELVVYLNRIYDGEEEV